MTSGRKVPGWLRLLYLDESGFSPSLPTGYSWCPPKQRKGVRYEHPQGRRVNGLASYEPSARDWMRFRSSGR